MKVTRKQLLAARHPRCTWSEATLAANMERRFPGGKDIDVAKLIDAWLADRSLSLPALAQASFLAMRLTPRFVEVEEHGKMVRKGLPGGSFLDPRGALLAIKASLAKGRAEE